jgi:penicillin-binding protein 1A
MWTVARQLVRAVVLFFVCTVVVPITVAGVVLATFIFVPLPATLPPLKDVKSSQASRVLDYLGNEIGTFKAFEQSVPFGKGDVPAVLKNAVIAAEDARFYQHSGVDVRGSTRAFVRDLQGASTLQGGSTITQQYVKLTETDQQRTIIRKIKEAVLASQYDRQFEKDDILWRYLSTIYLGEGAFGAGAAAQTYFRKSLRELTVSEAATLAGIIPAPSAYSARDHIQASENKRQIVLKKMLDQRYIDQAQYDAAVAAPLTFSPTALDPATATTVYPEREVVSRYPYFIDYVHRYLKDKYGEDTVLRGGLTIQTTLDQDLQQKAEATVLGAVGKMPALKGPKGEPNPMGMGLVAVEPGTGYVKALVGGVHPTEPKINPYGSVNIALGGCPTKPTDKRIVVKVEAECWKHAEPVEGGGSGRQPGSSFKPFALAAAFEKGIPPTKVYPAPSVYTPPGCKEEKCRISGGAGGSITLQQATTNSVNTVFAQLAQDIGNESIANMAKNLGVTSAWLGQGVHGASYVLGTLDVSPLDMAAAYSVFANRGLRNPATPVVKVVDSTNKVLEDNLAPKNDRVLDETVADNMNQALQGPLQSGTARGKGIDRPAAGKTGTTNDSKDAWFVGYTPNLSVAVSMGYYLPEPSKLFGGTIPASTWQAFMKQALANTPVAEFNAPAPITKVEDAILREKRGGIDPGERRNVANTGPGGPYEVGPPSPGVQAPPSQSATTTTQPSSGSTTSTTRGPFVTIPGP